MHLFNLKKSLVSLYICLVALLAVVTFVEHVRGTEFVEKYVYHTVWFCCLWGVLAALAVAVLVKRQLWRRLPTLLLHGSFLVILVGAMITFSYSKKGYMHLTVGTEVGTFIDQDSKRVIELPFTLCLDSFRVEYYPGTDAPADTLAIFGMRNLFPRIVSSLVRGDRKSTRLNSSHRSLSRMPSSA